MQVHSLPNFSIEPIGNISKSVLDLGLNELHQVVKYVHKLPYGRNSDRSNYNLVLKENKGTCSTKHALLAALCIEQGVQSIKLYTGIYEMDDANTPGIGGVLERFGLRSIPEAHCYLKYKQERYDFTRFCESGHSNLQIIKEENILPNQIGEFKETFHRSYIQNWLQEGELRPFQIDDIWSVREACIQALS
ncbi:hypothetical protein J2R98_000754 [Alkalibacillus filiformis]|uniref:Transglutaminase-like domain-containing protein n=1 Tax=Alkalibacillus filiformis TaxID=200990 RepID=A0ABU0DRK2_9BACI|nr:hypothetical protein [Alkalibacillus filiformis]MDQ0350951.1 hypothetical protein [Alkalibacillus filiformis]